MDFSFFFRPPSIDFTALGEPELKIKINLST